MELVVEPVVDDVVLPVVDVVLVVAPVVDAVEPVVSVVEPLVEPPVAPVELDPPPPPPPHEDRMRVETKTPKMTTGKLPLTNALSPETGCA